MTNDTSSFNLWHEPWIRAIGQGGEIAEVSLADALHRAPELRALHEASPIVAAGIHRLLGAIAQAIERPMSVAQLGAALSRNHFGRSAIEEFGARYADRFDLFSTDRPFLQSGDIPLVPRKEDKVKSVAYLAPEVPAGTEITHWRHGDGSEQAFCPRCCAGGLVAIPVFATSGGAGIKPSINGVPPLYVLPQGDTLFEALALSMVTPGYQPRASSGGGTAWWEAGCIVRKGEEVTDVGYLESLTFPARRVRLFPSEGGEMCTRCGCRADALVRQMVFDMGRSRPKGASAWLDPFAAYHITAKGPVPVRPVQGKSTWRDYSPLFLTRHRSNSEYQRPSVIDQLDVLIDEEHVDEDRLVPFRCIGLRTDMKAKVFEWTDSVLRVPVRILSDPGLADAIARDSGYAKSWASDLGGIFGAVFDPNQRGDFRSIRQRMLAEYWTTLEPGFRRFVLSVAQQDEGARHQWVQAVLNSGLAAFHAAADEIGDRGKSLAQRAEADSKLRRQINSRRREWLGERAAARA